VSASVSEATFTERIDYGTPQCVATGTVVVKDLGGSLSFQWLGKEDVAAGELRRK